jgi:hypothetical protein
MSGTPYEMGFAHGSLLKDDIHALFPAFFQYIEDMVYEVGTLHTCCVCADENLIAVHQVPAQGHCRHY